MASHELMFNFGETGHFANGDHTGAPRNVCKGLFPLPPMANHILMSRPTLVFDVETIPRPGLRSRLTPPSEFADDSSAVEKWMATTPAFAQIVVIGCLSIWNGGTNYRGIVLERNTPENERAMLEEFWAIAKGHDQFVTFNGMAFDVPAIEFWSRISGAGIPLQISTQAHVSAFQHGHFDLARLVFPNRSRGGNLGNLAAALDIADESEADGASVLQWYANADLESVLDYNYNDLRLTAECFLKLYGREARLGPVVIPRRREG